MPLPGRASLLVALALAPSAGAEGTRRDRLWYFHLHQKRPDIMRTPISALFLTSLLIAAPGCKRPTKDKPIIYLYPEETTEVSVQFADEDSVDLSITYPEYGRDGWHVIAHPDGTLVDPTSDEEFYALYWEGVTAPSDPFSTGSVVADADTIDFLEDSLDQLGLTPREANEFIVYWAPLLQEHPHNFIHFATDEWDELVPLDITPTPDSVIRVMMYWSPTRPSLRVKPQVLGTPRREGFTVVEWGGSRLTKLRTSSRQ